MEEYKSNSNKSKEEKKVVTGSVTPKKKNEIQKFADIFISEDIQNVKTYIFMDVLVPAIKKAVSDIVTNGISMILYGETDRSKKGPTSSQTPYRSYYVKDSDRRRDTDSSYRDKSDYNELTFESRTDAELVVDAMLDNIRDYGFVSVADLYEFADIRTDNYTANKRGWTDITGWRIIPVRDGFALKLPKPLPLD